MKKTIMLFLFFSATFLFAAEYKSSYSKVVEETIDSIVQVNAKEMNIDVTSGQNIFENFLANPDDQSSDPLKNYNVGNLGSGVIAYKNQNTYYVITNKHIIENFNKISVTLNSEEEYDAEVVLSEDRIDIAILKFNCNKNIKVAKLGNSDKVKIGDIVIGIGSPHGFQGSVTMGIISSLHRKKRTIQGNVSDFIQTDASINEGNSGGALINTETGETIGINTWILGRNGSIGLNFAIPINNIKYALEHAINSTNLVYKWLGVSFADELEQESIKSLGENKLTKGALIVGVYHNSPADIAGIKPGDIIYQIDNFKIERMEDAVLYLSGIINDKSNVEIQISRFGEKIKLQGTLQKIGDAKKSENYPGIYAYPITEELKIVSKLDKNLHGALVIRVDKDTLAYRMGIVPKDIIKKINGIEITSLKDFYSILNEKNTEFKIEYTRGNEDKIIIFSLL